MTRAFPGKKMELLAPAGGREQLEYAIRYGADAVYLACGGYGMRQRADNFTIAQLPEIVGYAHARDVAVHVTTNIVMHEHDFEDLPGYFAALDDAGVDATIVSDLGALRLARKYAPHVAVHASTQASIANAEAALAWHDMGASRIVLARELSLADIKRITAKLPQDLEVEAFVHGAMCMAYSGRCMISDYLTGRSALTGNCTQPCRWTYSVVEESRPGKFMPVEETADGAYIFNAQDMNMICHLEELEDAGVDSIKIEGRNKKAFYVATVVNAYRQALAGVNPALLEHELDCTSHRPFSTGFYYGPAHQTWDSVDYIRGWEWAASVNSCSQEDENLWVYDVLCRNRFSLDDSFELVTPGASGVVLHISRIEGFPDFDLDPTFTVEEPVANRTMQHYVIVCDKPAREGDIIRVKR